MAIPWLIATTAVTLSGLSPDPFTAETSVVPPPAFFASTQDAGAAEHSRYRWTVFTTRQGLPSDKVFAVRIDGERVWVGTDAGLAVIENGSVRSFGVDDGLAHPAILALDVDAVTGDVWIATMGGLSRLTAERFETFNQFNSGLANDVVYAVAVDGPFVWAATASGASRLDTRTRQWRIFNETNAPMHEPWTYSVSVGEDLVYVAAWGGGILEYDKAKDVWKDYRDPDGEMELDIFPDDGLVHDVTSSVAFQDGIVWAATYFGLSRYDGVRWKGYFDDTSGLPSNFINFVRARGSTAWLCTDKGLSSFDGQRWKTYRRMESGEGELITTVGDDSPSVLRTSTAIPHNYVLGIDFQDDIVWVATEGGLGRGTPGRSGSDASSRSDSMQD
jgi:ligand-binding sensor domain-containing protein